MELNRYIDHTNLKPDATRADIQTLCAEAKAYHFASVCVNSVHIAQAVSYTHLDVYKRQAINGDLATPLALRLT